MNQETFILVHIVTSLPAVVAISRSVHGVHDDTFCRPYSAEQSSQFTRSVHLKLILGYDGFIFVGKPSRLGLCNADESRHDLSQPSEIWRYVPKWVSSTRRRRSGSVAVSESRSQSLDHLVLISSGQQPRSRHTDASDLKVDAQWLPVATRQRR
jgi:hypothetical protein